MSGAVLCGEAVAEAMSSGRHVPEAVRGVWRDGYIAGRLAPQSGRQEMAAARACHGLLGMVRSMFAAARDAIAPRVETTCDA